MQRKERASMVRDRFHSSCALEIDVDRILPLSREKEKHFVRFRGLRWTKRTILDPFLERIRRDLDGTFDAS